MGQSQPPRVGCPKTCKVLLVGSVPCHHNIEQLCRGGGSNPRGPIWDGRHEVQAPSSGLNQTQGRMLRPDSCFLLYCLPSLLTPTHSVAPQSLPQQTPRCQGSLSSLLSRGYLLMGSF